MGGGGDNITVHVEWLARHLTQQQEDAAATEQHRNMASTYRVSRVPGHVRLPNPDAYAPGLVAIGPLHAKDGETRLRAGNRLKMAYLHSLISRGGRPDPADHLAVIKDYVLLVAAREREARAMYAAEDVDAIGAEDFIHMLVLDGCFLIEHLVNVFTGKEEPSLHATPFGPAQLSVDVVLAENQIPFFVLVDIISSARTRLPEFDLTEPDRPALLMKLVLNYLGGHKGRDMIGGGAMVLPPADRVCHILHLLHAMVVAARTRWEPPPRIQDGAAVEMMQEAARLLRRLPLLLLVPLLYPILPEERRWRASYSREDLPSASDLKRMWVRFKKARGGGKASTAPGIASVLGPVPLAVKLEHEDRLRLPQLRIEFRTAPLLLNLMAFEQAAEQRRAGEVSAYVWLMAKLVQSAEDAGVVVAAEVVQSTTSAGSESKDDVARFFRRVGAASEAAAELEKSYLGETLQKLRERSQHPLFMMWADVQRNYFTVPWAVVAEFVAFITFISTILQTYGSFKH
ncbi:hypothetical protein HU200_009260 [Digitaria exilis]|uniref:Uncharacterized protein n=1 Tax=Digitaria exilis TaxID=1010633 RepID=A0A835FMI6_9POAL|nr:hypothetical protein HU200_009260 [Digitaria exilis]CAB3460096.1 unnamed protein product [Digitaria exilis]